MEIKWTESLVGDLHDIMIYLKKNKIGELLEILADYYIHKHNSSYENYTMNFSDSFLADNISEAEFKLAFICEIAHKIKYIGKKYGPKYTNKKISYNIYTYFSNMIQYCVSEIFHIEEKQNNYKIYYLNNILKQKLCKEHINLAYGLTKYLIDITNDLPHIINYNTSLLLWSQNFKIDLLSFEEIREIMEILGIRRSLFVRILFILAENLSQKKTDNLNYLWISKHISFTDYDSFLNVITYPLIEIIIFITAFKLEDPKFSKI